MAAAVVAAAAAKSENRLRKCNNQPATSAVEPLRSPCTLIHRAPLRGIASLQSNPIQSSIQSSINQSINQSITNPIQSTQSSIQSSINQSINHSITLTQSSNRSADAAPHCCSFSRAQVLTPLLATMDSSCTTYPLATMALANGHLCSRVSGGHPSGLRRRSSLGILHWNGALVVCTMPLSCS